MRNRREFYLDNRPIQTAQVWTPKVLKLQGEYLLCGGGEEGTPIKSSGTGMFASFLELAEATPAGILRFGRQWGALHIDPKPAPGLGRFLEPVKTWRALAVRLRALLRIGAELNVGRLGTKDDWSALGKDIEDLGRSIQEARFQVMAEVRRLVEQAQIRPRLYWHPDAGEWRIELDVLRRSNLLGMLVIRLMLAIADKQGYAVCCGCHNSYPAERRPAATRRNYCPACREKGIPFRDSKREQRRRKKEANV